MSRTLKPEDRIAHYRVVGPLGAGGMGEVYRAQDQSLERDVALKILPPELVRSEERVRRFVLEAKSASSLNHPNIVTIYEIGEDRVRFGDGTPEPDSAPLHFISMELVSGKTLASKIHQERTDLKTLLGWLAQAAEGLAKAHAAGIVHRDLKPGNIMVSQDGYAKVLDFGLAKLTERQATDPAVTTAPTLTAEGTSAGVVLGTVGYMAPEQVRGQAVDARADVFSFGAILYEATTRRRPFAAESQVETMHQILHAVPEPIEGLNPEAPAELRRLIRRCLAKDPNQRLDSMKTLALELREIVEEYDALSVSSSSSGIKGAERSGSTRRPALLVGAAAVLVLVILATLWLTGSLPTSSGRQSSDAIQMTSLSSRGNVREAALSPDGRYLAFIAGPTDQFELWIRQLQTETEARLVPAQGRWLAGPRFSPDGSYVYFQMTASGGAADAFRIASLGGEPTKVATDVISAVEPSPDGKSLAFVRRVVSKKIDALILLDLASGEERMLSFVRWPIRLLYWLSWSSDGKLIAGTQATPPGPGKGARLQPVVARVSDGRLQLFGPDTLGWGRLSWLPGGRGLLVEGLAVAKELGARNPIRVLEYPGGRLRSITHDLGNYSSLSLSADGKALVAVNTSSVTNLWACSGAHGEPPRALSTVSKPDQDVLTAVPSRSGSIVWLDASRGLFRRVASEGSGDKPFLSRGPFGSSFRSLPDGGLVFSRYDDHDVGWLSRCNADGDSVRRLVDAPAWVRDISGNGEWMLFHLRASPEELWVRRVEGGTARLVTSTFLAETMDARLSPDGTLLVIMKSEGDVGSHRRVLAVSRTADGGEVAELHAPATASDLEWTPDGRAITLRDDADQLSNVFRWRFGHDAPEAVTHFTDGQILDHEWSPSGRLLLVRQQGPVTTLWMAASPGKQPVQVARFDVGAIWGADWLIPESRGAFILHRREESDVVMIRNFQ